MIFAFTASLSPLVSNSNGVNSNEKALWRCKICKCVSNSNGVNFNKHDYIKDKK